MMKKQIRAWNGRNFMIFGFLIACIVVILINLKVAKSKPEFEPVSESGKKLMEQILREANSLPKKNNVDSNSKLSLCYIARKVIPGGSSNM